MNSHTHPPLSVALSLAMTMALAPLAIDTYLPAFPQMAEQLEVSIHAVSLSIATYVFILAVAQLVGGPLSDRIGRAPVMLSGMAIFIVASLAISQVTSLGGLLAARGVQAFGGGWAMVCVAATVRDKLSGAEAARFFSLIGLMMIIAPAFAPSIGSLLLMLSSWPLIFIFLAGYGMLTALLVKTQVFKTGTPKPSQSVQLSLWERYRAVLSNRQALRFLALQTLSFSVMLLFISHSSFIYQEHFGASPNRFSLLFGANILVMLAMNMLNRKLLKQHDAFAILRWTVSMQFTGILLLIMVVTLAPTLGLFLPAMMFILLLWKIRLTDSDRKLNLIPCCIQKSF